MAISLKDTSHTWWGPALHQGPDQANDLSNYIFGDPISQ